MLSLKILTVTIVAFFFLTGYTVQRECPSVVKEGGFIIEIDRKCNIKKISIDTE